MKQAIRVVVVIVAAFAAFYFTFFMFSVPFATVLPKHRWLSAIPTLGALLCATMVVRYIWMHSAALSQGLFGSVLIGAVVTGGIGFTAGFVGPIVFAPDANQGPLLGILITGPLGFLLGAVGGGVYWLVRGSTAGESTQRPS